MKIELGKKEVESMVSDWVYKNFVEKTLDSCKVDGDTISIEVSDYVQEVHREDYVEDLGSLERKALNG
jgi:hypothetical protein